MNRGMMGINGCMMGMNMRNTYYNKNVPLGIITSDGVLYRPLFFDTNKSIDNIKDYIGKQVEVTGATYGNCMMSGLRITSIKESE